MIRRPPRSTLDRSSAASDVYKRQSEYGFKTLMGITPQQMTESLIICGADIIGANCGSGFEDMIEIIKKIREVSELSLIHISEPTRPY